MAFKSKYTGNQIEKLLDSVNNGEIGGATLTENDIAGMGFTKNTGTITAIQANGTTVASSGTANIPAATTGAYGVTKLSTSTSSTSTSLAATASAVKSAYDLANGKQDKLVSGTNIKTINGQSLLGSGNITIEGGSGSGSLSSGGGTYAEVNHGTSDTTFTLTPNIFHVWDEVAELNLSLGAETSGVANEYLFQFASPSTPTTLTLPDDIKFSEDLVIEANKIYQISILKGLGSVLEFEREVASIFPLYFEVWTDGSYSTGVRQPDADSIALADYVVENLSSDGIAYECYMPEGSVYIDGHEVSCFICFAYAATRQNCFEWYFKDGYKYPGMFPISELYVNGDNHGLMRAYDDD